MARHYYDFFKKRAEIKAKTNNEKVEINEMPVIFEIRNISGVFELDRDSAKRFLLSGPPGDDRPSYSKYSKGSGPNEDPDSWYRENYALIKKGGEIVPPENITLINPSDIGLSEEEDIAYSQRIG